MLVPRLILAYEKPYIIEETDPRENMMERPIFKVIIAGGRTFQNYEVLRDFCDKCLSRKAKTHQIEVLSGCCRGADILGQEYARKNGFSIWYMPANWRDGKSAGPQRNQLMAENADALIAFWDGRSRGTKNMIEIAKKLKLLIRVKMY